MQNLKTALLTAALLIAPAMTSAQETPVAANINNIAADQVSFYGVPLACPAARGLGCGGRAKPVLMELEGNNVIEEAWLDRAGTTLAVVSKKGVCAEDRGAEVQAVMKKHNLSMSELTGKQRDEAVKSFLARKDWYRGTAVDRLSEEEAGVIAGRWIRRAVAEAPTVAGKSDTLKLALTGVVREKLVGCPGQSAECLDNFHKKLAAMAQTYLNKIELDALLAAVKLGVRPVGDEQ